MNNTKKNLLLYPIGMIVCLASQWLITILAVRLSPDFTNAGILALAMTITNTVSQFATFGIRVFQVSDSDNKYTESTYIAHRLITVLISGALCGAFILLNDYDAYMVLCIAMYTVYKLFECYSDVFFGILQKAERLYIAGFSFLMRGVISLVIFWTVMSVVGNMLFAFIGMSLASLAVTLFYDIKNTRKISPIKYNFDKAIISLSKETVFYFLYSVLVSLATFFPKYFLELYHGSASLGIFSSVSAPALLMQALLQTLFFPLVGSITKYYKNNDYRSLVKITIIAFMSIVLLAFLFIIGCMLFGEFFLVYIFNDDILGYSQLLIPIVVWCSVNVVCMFFGTVLTIMRKIKTMIISTLISIISSFIFSVILIPAYYMDGTNYSMFLALAVQGLICIVAVAAEIKRIKKLKEYV